MARIELAPEFLDDLDRFLEHLLSFDVDDVPNRIADIVQALDVLQRSPLIGLPVKRGRELVIGRGSHGHVALYRFVPVIDTVFVLAIRSRREAGYRSDR